MTYEVEETRHKGRTLELHLQLAPREEAEVRGAFPNIEGGCDIYRVDRLVSGSRVSRRMQVGAAKGSRRPGEAV
jgi:hypothetical protein